MNDDDKMIIEISPNVFMPRLAFGTYKLKGEDCRRALRKALEVGYEHIDTASIYKNENEIGEVLEEWMMKHENENENENGQNKKKKKKMPFLASKIAPAEMHSQLLVEQAVDKILGRLKLSSIDLLMLHWPGVSKVSPDSEIHKKRRKDAYRGLEKCLKEGKVRAIGVSNYHVGHLEELLSYCEIKPSVNQIEVHPMWPQEELIDFCEKNGITVVKYSPFGGGGAPLLDEAFVSMREKEGGVAEGGDRDREEGTDIVDDQAWKPSQILLAWSLLRGGRTNRGNNKTVCGAVVVKASSEERILENYKTLEKDFFNSKYLSHALQIWDSVKTRKKFAWDSDCVK